VECLHSWNQGHEEYSRYRGKGGSKLCKAIADQDEIGWWNFLFGRMSLTLIQAHEAHLESIDSKKSAKKWARDLAKELYMVNWAMWDHWNQVNQAGISAQALHRCCSHGHTNPTGI
jgi:hypothetical protein